MSKLRHKYSTEDYIKIIKDLDPTADFICVERTKGKKNRRTFLYFEYAGQVWKGRMENLSVGHRPWFNQRNFLPVLYKFLNSEGELLYVGKSTRFGSRLNEHKSKKNSKWFDEVKDVQIAYPKTETDMHILEPYLISLLKPRYNREFVGGGESSFQLQEPIFYNATRYKEDRLQ